MNDLRIKTVAMLAIIAEIGLAQSPAAAAPSAEVAKRCMHYSYVVYPYKRPGAVRMSGDRQAYFKDCMAKNGDVPAPVPAANKADAATKR
jgi:hypothetical protein